MLVRTTRKEKRSYEISAAVSEHDIPQCLILNIDQTPLSYVTPRKYTFSFKGAKNVPIRGVDDKRQITTTFAVSFTGDFLPMQLIYSGKNSTFHTKIKFSCQFFSSIYRESFVKYGEIR